MDAKISHLVKVELDNTLLNKMILHAVISCYVGSSGI